MDEGQQAVERRLVALAPRLQQVRYIGTRSSNARILRRFRPFSSFGLRFPPPVREEGDDVAKATYTLALGIVVTAALMTPQRVDASDQQETTNPAAAVLIRRAPACAPRIRSCRHIDSGRGRRSTTFDGWSRRLLPLMVWSMSCAVDVPVPSEPV